MIALMIANLKLRWREMRERNKWDAEHPEVWTWPDAM